MIDDVIKYDLPDAKAADTLTQDTDEQKRELVLACVRTKITPTNLKNFVSTNPK